MSFSAVTKMSVECELPHTARPFPEIILSMFRMTTELRNEQQEEVYNGR